MALALASCAAISNAPFIAGPRGKSPPPGDGAAINDPIAATILADESMRAERSWNQAPQPSPPSRPAPAPDAPLELASAPTDAAPPPEPTAFRPVGPVISIKSNAVSAQQAERPIEAPIAVGASTKPAASPGTSPAVSEQPPQQTFQEAASDSIADVIRAGTPAPTEPETPLYAPYADDNAPSAPVEPPVSPPVDADTAAPTRQPAPVAAPDMTDPDPMDARRVVSEAAAAPATPFDPPIDAPIAPDTMTAPIATADTFPQAPIPAPPADAVDAPAGETETPVQSQAPASTPIPPPADNPAATPVGPPVSAPQVSAPPVFAPPVSGPPVFAKLDPPIESPLAPTTSEIAAPLQAEPLAQALPRPEPVTQEPRTPAPAEQPRPAPAAIDPSTDTSFGNAPALWKITDDDSTVYLFGALHVLPDNVPWRTRSLDEAMADAEVTVVEADAASPEAIRGIQAAVARYGLNPQGVWLSDEIGAQRFEMVADLAGDLGLATEQLEAMRPWLALVSLSQAVFQRFGFSPETGVEAAILTEAARQGDRLAHLETAEEQIRVLADLPRADMLANFDATFDQLAEFRETTDRMLTAWRTGDLVELEAIALAPLREESPTAYDAIFADRNFAWAAAIADMLKDDEDYFIAVGVGHLVGADSVIAVLATRGITARRVQ